MILNLVVHVRKLSILKEHRNWKFYNENAYLQLINLLQLEPAFSSYPLKSFLEVGFAFLRRICKPLNRKHNNKKFDISIKMHNMQWFLMDRNFCQKHQICLQINFFTSIFQALLCSQMCEKRIKLVSLVTFISFKMN